MKWDRKYVDFGKITFSGNTIYVWSSQTDRTMLVNPPCGQIKDVYWRGDVLVVERTDGWVYNYKYNGSYSSLWKK